MVELHIPSKEDFIDIVRCKKDSGVAAHISSINKGTTSDEVYLFVEYFVITPYLCYVKPKTFQFKDPEVANFTSLFISGIEDELVLCGIGGGEGEKKLSKRFNDHIRKTIIQYITSEIPDVAVLIVTGLEKWSNGPR